MRYVSFCFFCCLLSTPLMAETRTVEIPLPELCGFYEAGLNAHDQIAPFLIDSVPTEAQSISLRIIGEANQGLELCDDQTTVSAFFAFHWLFWEEEMGIVERFGEIWLKESGPFDVVDVHHPGTNEEQIVNFLGSENPAVMLSGRGVFSPC